jgi:spore germination cell wall hydrolase CwlJ-like protein
MAMKETTLERRMRAAKILKSTLCITATLVVPLSASANEAQAKALQKTEKRGLSSVSKLKLNSLVKAPPKAKGVHFSRAWLDAQPKAKGDAQWACLSEALYFEARGETVKGQFAVAEVIMNRVAHSRFPQTLCGVINQGTGKKYGCQFTYTCDGIAEKINEPSAFSRVSKVARAVIDSKAPKLTNGATHYHTTAVSPSWGRVYTKVARIGVHIFYRHNVRSVSN